MILKVYSFQLEMRYWVHTLKYKLSNCFSKTVLVIYISRRNAWYGPFSHKLKDMGGLTVFFNTVTPWFTRTSAPEQFHLQTEVFGSLSLLLANSASGDKPSHLPQNCATNYVCELTYHCSLFSLPLWISIMAFVSLF